MHFQSITSSAIGLLVGFCLFQCWNKECCISYDSDIISAMFPGNNQLATVKSMAKQILFVNHPPVSFWFLFLFLMFPTHLFMFVVTPIVLLGIHIFLGCLMSFFQRSQSLSNTDIYLLLPMAIWPNGLNSPPR